MCWLITRNLTSLNLLTNYLSLLSTIIQQNPWTRVFYTGQMDGQRPRPRRSQGNRISLFFREESLCRTKFGTSWTEIGIGKFILFLWFWTCGGSHWNVLHYNETSERKFQNFKKDFLNGSYLSLSSNTQPLRLYVRSFYKKWPLFFSRIIATIYDAILNFVTNIR